MVFELKRVGIMDVIQRAVGMVGEFAKAHEARTMETMID